MMAGRTVAPLLTALQVIASMAVGFCGFRGLPVIIHSLRHYWGGARIGSR